MTNFNPLTKILDKNYLTGSNFVDWKRNLMIVLTADKIAHVLKGDTPDLALMNGTQEQKELFEKWHEHDEMAKCYMLASMTNMLQKQCEGMATASCIMLHMQEMFGEQSRAARTTAMKNFTNTKMVEGTSVKDHVVKMISYANELKLWELR